jgi:hypothetical protein
MEACYRKACAMLDGVAPQLGNWRGKDCAMTTGSTPQQGYIAGESRKLADADFSQGEHAQEDHSAHAAGEICKSCGHTIEAGQAARRRGETEWAHDVCPVVRD